VFFFVFVKVSCIVLEKQSWCSFHLFPMFYLRVYTETKALCTLM